MMRTRVWSVVVCGALAVLTLGIRPAETARPAAPATVAQLLALPGGPFAIGHRGSGENAGEDGSRPVENTVQAVRLAFEAGLSVAEVDVQVTRDGGVAALHDDVLPDGTCVNDLTLSELQTRLPHVPSLQAILNQTRRFNQASGPLRGILIVEMKAASPQCDPDDLRDPLIASAVIAVVHRMGMSDQVILASLSPALLYLAADAAPDIARALTVSGLQLMTAEDLIALGLEVTLVDKSLDLGLQWAEVALPGMVSVRLPGYRSPDELLLTVGITGARILEADDLLLGTAGSPFVEALHLFGVKVFGWTAQDAADWAFFASTGVDGIYTDDIRLGLEQQAPIP